ncbi:hypothetical protein LR48_Vigan349s000700 [Vigna angularis]|uniref:Uncharacterized protein n=1 Tax=Phaseolus angularis TaxID=3914 RepID=A0A0L9T8U4_PHAAN|nr:hypothetical protein LR48_Vigan349s000700 [Vigna angularis]
MIITMTRRAYKNNGQHKENERAFAHPGGVVTGILISCHPSISVYVDVEGPVVGGYPDTLIIIQSHVEKDELCGERSRRFWSMFRCGHSEGTNLVNGMKYFGSVFVRKSRSHNKCITSRDRSSTYHLDECLVGIVGVDPSDSNQMLNAVFQALQQQNAALVEQNTITLHNQESARGVFSSVIPIQEWNLENFLQHHPARFDGTTVRMKLTNGLGTLREFIVLRDVQMRTR